MHDAADVDGEAEAEVVRLTLFRVQPPEPLRMLDGIRLEDGVVRADEGFAIGQGD